MGDDHVDHERLRQFLRAVTLLRDRVEDFDAYPFSIPAIRALDTLDLDPRVTFLVGENGSGKSTLLEAIAIACRFNPEGGSVNLNFATRASESSLHEYLRIVRGAARPRDGFFLRAESYFNVGTELEQVTTLADYGGVSVHEQSHGESFLRLVKHRFGGDGLYLLDDPEAALSPSRQLSFLTLLDDLVRRRRSQFVIATHSPIIMAYPGATIVQLDADGLRTVAYEDTEHFRITRDFLAAPEAFLRHLMDDDGAPS